MLRAIAGARSAVCQRGFFEGIFWVGLFQGRFERASIGSISWGSRKLLRIFRTNTLAGTKFQSRLIKADNLVKLHGSVQKALRVLLGEIELSLRVKNPRIPADLKD